MSGEKKATPDAANVRGQELKNDTGSIPQAGLTVDPEFRDLIPPLSADERAGLEENILIHGCRVPLDVWDGILVDGHQRYEICKRHGIPFEIHEKDFEDRHAAMIWIMKNQLGRKNLTPFEMSETKKRIEARRMGGVA